MNVDLGWRETALPCDPPGELVVLDGPPEGGKIHDLTGTASAFSPDYTPEEMIEIANKLYKKAKPLSGPPPTSLTPSE
jgi:manganese catalase